MSEFDKDWDVEMAMAVMRDPHADAKIWADAVQWLLANGPPEIQALIQQASSHATARQFPDLRPTGYSEDGQPLYEIKALAEALAISEEEAGKRLSELQSEVGVRTIFSAGETHKIH